MIRPATMADVDRIVEMSEAFYATTQYAGTFPVNRVQLAGLAIVTMRDHIMLVAEKDGVVVGMASLLIEPFVFNPTYTAAVELVWWLDEAARGGMLAARLLKKIEEACRERGAHVLRMALLATSPAHAEGIYNKFGFHKSDSHYEKVL